MVFLTDPCQIVKAETSTSADLYCNLQESNLSKNTQNY